MRGRNGDGATRDWENAHLIAQIRQIHDEDPELGAERVWEELTLDRGIEVGLNLALWMPDNFLTLRPLGVLAKSPTRSTSFIKCRLRGHEVAMSNGAS